MNVIWSAQGAYLHQGYASEADLETAIVRVQNELFGQHRIYLDIKKKIGIKGSRRNIPDGYLIDLSSRTPRLYVVENELASHDPLRHIAMQLLEFSLAFESEPRRIKLILYNALQELPDARAHCEQYAVTNGYRNLDYLLDVLVHEAPFAALVIIDEIPTRLEKILAEKFKFGTEVLALQRYVNSRGEHLYHFEPFLAELNEDIGVSAEPSGSAKAALGISEIDTVVVPAREETFQAIFLGENRWYAVRLHGTMRPQIKHIAVYRVAPISAITHIAPVEAIEPYGDSGKYSLKFAEPAREISPIAWVKGGRVTPIINQRYTTLSRLENARTLDEVW
jgi:hypothetical protein